MQKPNTKPSRLFIAIAAASLGLGHIAIAQENSEEVKKETSNVSLPALDPIDAPVVEEMLILGRQQSAAQSIMSERLEQAFSADLLGSEQMTRTGDSNIAIALTRVTGVTLIDNKYVYVRSLGERYSSVTLNGANIPSPELTRNVLPLDLIPSSIVESLKVQKAYSPNLPAHFGGGGVDIRTKPVPDEFLFNISFGTGMNTESDDGLSHNSHGIDEPMPHTIRTALDTYQGKIDIQDLTTFIQRQNPSFTFAQANSAALSVSRDLILSLNRDVQPTHRSLPADYSNSLGIGNSWDLNDDFVLGGVVNFSQDSKWRNKNQIERNVGAPDTNYSTTKRTTEETRQVMSLNLGVTYQEAHKIQVGAYQIEDIDDEASIENGFNNNLPSSGNVEFNHYDTRIEKRQLELGQVLGEHSFDQFNGEILDTIKVDWFYSDSKATTDVPNHASVKGNNTLDPNTGEVISSQLSPAAAMASFEFLNLKDDVESYGWNAKLPLSFERMKLELSAGYSYNDKTREYYAYTINVNGLGLTSNILAGNINTALSDNNIRNNAFTLDAGGQFGTESYIAAQMNEAGYFMLDATWNETWRFTAGARSETFRQAVLPLDLLDYSGNSLQQLIIDLQDPDQTYTQQDDSWHPSLAVTYMNEGFMNTEIFQLRFSASQTLVRPDLREVSDVVYIDSEYGWKVKGNTALVSSDITHFDIRGEWFFDDGNNFTASLFYKDIENPIESSRTPGSDDDVILTFENALSGEVYGLEMEALRDLGRGFFIASNLTLSESEIESDLTQNFTNPVRPMTGQSEYVLNAQLGFDSPDGEHAVSLVYNLFGERLFFAARGTDQEDAYEQPFNSLDVTYSWMPTENISTRLKLNNLLNEERVFEQVNNSGQNVEILQQDIGVSVSAELKYSF
jgi:TonB-dependent receptor